MSENPVPFELGPRVIDFSNVTVIGLSGGGGIISINGDATPAQLLTAAPVPGTSDAIIITDDGIGGHTFNIRGLFATNGTPAGLPVNVPAGVKTPVITLSVPAAGLWFFTANVNAALVPGSIVMRTSIDNGGSDIGESFNFGNVGASLNGIGASVISYLLACGGGEIITVSCWQDSAGPIDMNAFVNGIRIGSF